MAIYKAILKHGHSNFSLEILEYCDRDSVIAREQYYLDHLEHEYNLSPTAGSRLGYRHTEETKAKLRTANLGRKHSEATKSKLRALFSQNQAATLQNLAK
jgi:group I intron endonuclease